MELWKKSCLLNSHKKESCRCAGLSLPATFGSTHSVCCWNLWSAASPRKICTFLSRYLRSHEVQQTIVTSSATVLWGGFIPRARDNRPRSSGKKSSLKSVQSQLRGKCSLKTLVLHCSSLLSIWCCITNLLKFKWKLSYAGKNKRQSENSDNSDNNMVLS